MTSPNQTPEKDHVFWRRLLAEVDIHAVAPGALGEYAAVVADDGIKAADVRFPEVTAHLNTGCPRCREDLLELRAILAEESAEAQAGITGPAIDPAGALSQMATQMSALQAMMMGAVQDLNRRLQGLSAAVNEAARASRNWHAMQAELQALRIDFDRLNRVGSAAPSSYDLMNAARRPAQSGLVTFRFPNYPGVHLDVASLPAVTVGQLLQERPRRSTRALSGWEVTLQPRAGSGRRPRMAAITDDRGLAVFEAIEADELQAVSADVRPPA